MAEGISPHGSKPVADVVTPAQGWLDGEWNEVVGMAAGRGPGRASVRIGCRGGTGGGGRAGDRSVADPAVPPLRDDRRSEEHTSELQSLMRISYAVLCLNKKNNTEKHQRHEE